ncbi:uncharacterized protein [Magallana gigas]|uniref:uncharacterized protein isoform X2 n=1 Tax=Magallana gigas TaxID=29159 RepID=UPI0033412768
MSEVRWEILRSGKYLNTQIHLSVLIHESKATANKPENCTEFTDDNFTYSVTRYDNGALFRCSSQNNLTQGLGPSRDSLKISVIYGPDKPVITLTPLKSFYFVGDHLTIQCITDSNPPPVFTWKFHPHNKSLETVIKTSSDVSKLVFYTLQTTDSGTYSCTATNAARLNSENVTSSVSIYVSHSEMSNQGCNQCGYLTVCQQYDGKTVCVTNKWVPIAIVFILISVSFAAASIVLIKNKSASEDDGGYQAHAEIVNTHVYSALKSNQPETGVYTTLQSNQSETGVYTSLQSQRPETRVYTSLQSHQPETGVYSSLQSHKPETGVYTSLQSHQPETGVYTSIQSHQPETGVYTSLQSRQPETGVYTSLQSHQPETGVNTSLQSQRPETGENASLPPYKPETGVYTAVQSQRPESDEYTSLESQRPETGEHALLQSHKSETGEYTSIDNVS